MPQVNNGPRELSGGFAWLLNEYRITKTHTYRKTGIRSRPLIVAALE